MLSKKGEILKGYALETRVLQGWDWKDPSSSSCSVTNKQRKLGDLLHFLAPQLPV